MPAESTSLPATPTSLPRSLYHYTDINGLRGIWENGELWATHYQYLNDTTEFKLGISAAISLITMLISELEARRGMSQDVATEVFKLEDIRRSLEQVSSECYIACLSEMGDQLSQWRGYAREGFCIQLRADALNSGLRGTQTLRPVQYYDENAGQGVDYIKRLIDRARIAYSALALDQEVDLDDEFRSLVIGKEVAEGAVFMKDGGFAEEREFRIVEFGAAPGFFTTSSRYGMVPRIGIPIAEAAIQSITIGPSVHAELKRHSLVRYFLNVPFKRGVSEARGYRTRPRVVLSEIPFRDW